MRQGAGFTGRALADELSWDPTKISKIEHGRQLPSVDEVRQWSHACGADRDTVDAMVAALERVAGADVDWRTRVSGGRGLPTVQEWVLELYRTTRHVSTVETSTIPGLAQIDGYARRVLAEMAAIHRLDWGDDDLDRAVSARLRRQELLYDRAKSFDLLMTEPVLGWAYCDPATMAAQMDRLLSLEALPNVRFGIVPQSPGAPIVQHGFSVFDDLVIVETSASEHHHQGDETAAAYLDHLRRYWSAAVEGDAARRIILRYAERYRSDP